LYAKISLLTEPETERRTPTRSGDAHSDTFGSGEEVKWV
jgi:hypothetical protein